MGGKKDIGGTPEDRLEAANEKAATDPHAAEASIALGNQAGKGWDPSTGPDDDD